MDGTACQMPIRQDVRELKKKLTDSSGTLNWYTGQGKRWEGQRKDCRSLGLQRTHYSNTTAPALRLGSVDY